MEKFPVFIAHLLRNGKVFFFIVHLLRKGKVLKFSVFVAHIKQWNSFLFLLPICLEKEKFFCFYCFYFLLQNWKSSMYSQFYYFFNNFAGNNSISLICLSLFKLTIIRMSWWAILYRWGSPLLYYYCKVNYKCSLRVTFIPGQN
jgi:hypothetical protein